MAMGCGGYVSSAKRAYGQGRYLEVAEKLSQHEPEVEKLSPDRKAEYGMYRGLSLMMLSDYPGAMQWLGFAYEVEQRHPGTLRPEQRKELDHGWGQVTQALGAAPPSIVLAPAASPAPEGPVSPEPLAPPSPPEPPPQQRR